MYRQWNIPLTRFKNPCIIWKFPTFVLKIIIIIIIIIIAIIIIIIIITVFVRV